MEEIWIGYTATGLVAGFLGGLLGIGGGIVAVPALLVLFSLQGFAPAYAMHAAIATSLAAMIFNTLAASIAHARKGHILWPLFARLVPGVVIGAVAGAFLATLLTGKELRGFFALFLLALAIHFFTHKTTAARSFPPLLLSVGGTLIGILSNLLGIGGGSMTVPLLTAYGIRGEQAVGTSSITTLVTTLLGALSYFLLSDRLHTTLVNPPAFFIVGAAALCAAPLGAALVRYLQPQRLRSIFSTVLLLTALSLLWGN
jgi:uncharacterized membrane protein YfcA